jgi:hypothetical protein
MAGQPTRFWLTFDVSNITFAEAGLQPSNIVAPGGTFAISVTFTGAGPIFSALEGNPPLVPGVPYTVTVSAESLAADGGGTYEGVLGVFNGTLAPGRSPYTAVISLLAGAPSGPSQDGSPVPPQLPKGLYKITAVVQLAAPWNFVVGYFESPDLLQVY